MLEIKKGNNSAKRVSGVTSFNLRTSSGHALYFYQVSWNNLEWYQSYRADTITILKISKENNSAKNDGGATVFNLCMSSGHALYLCQVSWNNLKRYQSYRVDSISIRKTTKGNKSTKLQMVGHLLISARRLVMLYISTKFCEIISHGIKVLEWTRFLNWKLQREIIPQKMLVKLPLLISARCLVMMLHISTKFCEIISNGIKVIERTRFLYWK